jgi:hypothetical protein
VAASDAGADPTLGSAHTWHILYRSEPAHGAGTALVSGMVLVPKGGPPRGGWPVVAWAHGTTGMTSACAPSLVADLAHDPSAVGEVAALLAHGWAVVATDYLGLGTAGIHPYLMGSVNGAAVVDSVVAAHELSVHLTREWAVVGHSEGGQSALFAAQQAGRATRRGLPYLGVVALAPASTLEALLALAESSHDPVDEAYAAFALAGMAQVDPTFNPKTVLAPAAALDVTDGCVDQVTERFRRLRLTQFATTDIDLRNDASRRIGDLADPDRVAAPGPILVEQGTADTDVPLGATIGMVQRLCALGDDVTFHQVKGVDHGQLLPASRVVVTRWLDDRFAGVPATSNCAADPSGTAAPQR